MDPPQTPKPQSYEILIQNKSPAFFWSSKGFAVIFTVSEPTRQSPCLLLVSPSFGETKLPSNSASWRAFCALPAPGPSGTGNRCQGSVGWGLDWSFWLTSSRANMRLGNFFVFFKIDFRFKFGCQMIFCPCFWLRYALAGSTWTTGRSIHRRFQEVSPVWAAAEHKSTGGLSFRVYWSCTSVHRLPHRVA